MSRYLCPFLRTLWKEQFSSATLILIISLLLLLELWKIASESKAKMKNLSPDIETTVKIRLGKILEKLTQRHNRREHARSDKKQDNCDNEKCASTQFLQIQKVQLSDLQKFLERYCIVSLVFGFNSTKYDLNIIESCLLTILVKERDIEPTVITKANQFISFKFGDNQLLDFMNFLVGATSLDSLLKA